MSVQIIVKYVVLQKLLLSSYLLYFAYCSLINVKECVHCLKVVKR